MTTTELPTKSKSKLELALEDFGYQVNVFRRAHEPVAEFAARLIAETRGWIATLQGRNARLEDKIERIRNIVR